MKIKEVNTYLVRPRWCFVEIVTDEGLCGWGEAVIEGKASTVKACVEEMTEYLINVDPMRIEDIWNTLYRAGFYRGGPVIMSAISGIDQELQYIDSYDKIDAVLERVASIREATGKYFGIAIDFHGRVHKPMAKILAKKLEEFDPMFIEEPVLCENMEDFHDIATSCNIPIATGERLFSRWDFKRLLHAGGIDIIQPDLSHAGGITEVKKIASMAEAYDVALAPHCPLGPIALAACLQVDATCHNAVIQEQSIGIHYNVGKSVLDYITNKDDFVFTDGYVKLPKKTGLGVDINKELVMEENKTPHHWKNPVWRHKDGSIAEW